MDNDSYKRCKGYGRDGDAKEINPSIRISKQPANADNQDNRNNGQILRFKQIDLIIVQHAYALTDDHAE